MNAATEFQHSHTPWLEWAWGSVVMAAMGLYYSLFFFPPRLVGANDPDRYYHLGLAQLFAVDGLPRVLPQVEDLGWGHYFPDKEFLFHALTGTAGWLGGASAVMLVVPILGIAIAVVLYIAMRRVLHPARAAVLLLATCLLSPVLIFRITMLRPHLLAIFFFCLLLLAILRGRSWLAAFAAAGFALSYHALYVPVIVIVIAAMFRWPKESGGSRRWQWAAVGLLCGTLLNPYFPSTLVMGWIHVKLALGLGLPPGLRSGEELQPLSIEESVHYFGFLPLALIGAAALALAQRIRPSCENAEFWFLLTLSALLVALSMKSSRATEYAVPTIGVLVAYCLARLESPRWLWSAIVAMAVTQGSAAWIYYQDCWLRPQGGDSPAYLNAVALLPPEADGKKVFNCQWEAGSYLLFARPRVRFVDLLEPAFLWEASPEKYIFKHRLIGGQEANPYQTLRRVFKADYALCGTPALNAQMQRDPAHFKPITGTEPMNSLRLYQLQD